MKLGITDIYPGETYWLLCAGRVHRTVVKSVSWDEVVVNYVGSVLGDCSWTPSDLGIEGVEDTSYINGVFKTEEDAYKYLSDEEYLEIGSKIVPGLSYRILNKSSLLGNTM